MANVLIVDDSSSMRNLVASTLEDAGYQVTQAEDGVEALERARGLDGVALVITDVNMPKMDGLTLLAELRKLDAYRFTPILVLTTQMDAEKKKQAKTSGATGWLVKPFQPDKLLATIRRVLD